MFVLHIYYHHLGRKISPSKKRGAGLCVCVCMNTCVNKQTTTAGSPLEAGESQQLLHSFWVRSPAGLVPWVAVGTRMFHTGCRAAVNHGAICKSA